MTRLLSALGGFEGRISLNVTADVLATAQFPQRPMSIVAEAGVNIERLVLEVTETTLPTDPVRALAIQTRLRMLGVSLAVDDYGTSHSSLERLHTFPMDELKIDLSFVRESTSDPDARAIVHNSILLARDLRVRCVAEGVENVRAVRLHDRAFDYGGGGLLIPGLGAGRPDSAATRAVAGTAGR